MASLLEQAKQQARRGREGCIDGYYEVVREGDLLLVWETTPLDSERELVFMVRKAPHEDKQEE